ncbi:hypothetical protein NQ314_008296 [Rhamnusium bicolor]|uniref:Uncharacterized protein n=1 Tax=Rhamnusium bicolor TaxID=1586634 RepID=A0AAV8YD09_9CUCU|nr:hypothetical protein NQ314_008296 [Rhamnusium bicolor]
MKNVWPNFLKDCYRHTECKNVDKITFASLLKKLKETGCFSRANAIGGFEGAGIYPLNEDKIIKKCETSSVVSSTENVDQGEAITPNTSNANNATNSDDANSANSSRLSCRLERVASSSSTSNFSTSQQVGMSLKKSLELSILLALKKARKKTRNAEKEQSSPKIC